MNARKILGAIAMTACTLGLEAGVQDYPDATYYLHPGSTYQEGCFGLCACFLSEREPMHGTFALRLENIGNVTDFYSISNVRWRVPRIAGQPIDVRLTGAGQLLAGQESIGARHQHMTLDLSVQTQGGEPVGSTFRSEFGERTVPPPVIAIEVLNSTTGCPGIRLQVRASRYATDWNADGTSTLQDLFDYLAAYFAGRGDYGGDGTSDIEDLFAFLGDWFGGV
jgi:hypothetical protein